MFVRNYKITISHLFCSENDFKIISLTLQVLAKQINYII